MPAEILEYAQAPAARRPFWLRLWRTPFGQKVMPFLASLALHATIVTVGVLTIQVVRVAMDSQESDVVIEPPVCVGDVFLGVDPDATPGGYDAAALYRGSEDDPSLRPVQEFDPAVSSDSLGWNLEDGSDWDSVERSAADRASPAGLDGLIGLPGSKGDGGPLAPGPKNERQNVAKM